MPQAQRLGNDPQKPKQRRRHIVLRVKRWKTRRRDHELPTSGLDSVPRHKRSRWSEEVRHESKARHSEDGYSRKLQRSARPVGAGRSERGSCGLWCKALAGAGLRATQLRRLHALRLLWQPVSKRQLSETPKLQWFRRPEGWTERRGTDASQQSASAPFLFPRMQRRQPKPDAPPHRGSPAAKGPWRPGQTQ